MSENQPLVSCVINTFNRPDLVLEALESVLSQTYKNLEIIIIDDCSTADYSNLLNSYSESIVYKKNKTNLGLSASRNVGVSIAKGDYIAFLDDDDVWFEKKIELQIKVLEKNYKFIACSCSHIESESKKVIFHQEIFNKKDILKENLIGPPSKIVVRSSAFKKVKFDEELKHAEDWDLYLSLLDFSDVFCIKEPLVKYNTGHFERMTNGFSKLSIEEIKSKALATYKNKSVIGDSNFTERMAFYYLCGFPMRSNKVIFLFRLIPEIGFLNIIKEVFKRALR